MVTLIIDTRMFHSVCDKQQIDDIRENAAVHFTALRWEVKEIPLEHDTLFVFKKQVSESASLDDLLAQLVSTRFPLNFVLSVTVVADVERGAVETGRKQLTPEGETRYLLERRADRGGVAFRAIFPDSHRPAWLPVPPSLFWQICNELGRNAQRVNYLNQALALIREYESGMNAKGLVAARKKIQKSMSM